MVHFLPMPSKNARRRQCDSGDDDDDDDDDGGGGDGGDDGGGVVTVHGCGACSIRTSMRGRCWAVEPTCR